MRQHGSDETYVNILYHHNHGHDMKECTQLRDEIEEIWHGHLDKFLWNRQERSDTTEAPPHLLEPPPRPEEFIDRPTSSNVDIIIGGIARGGPSKRQKIKEADKAITFTWADAERIQYPHDDPMVVTLNIANYDVSCAYW